MTRAKYTRAEANVRHILEKSFQPFVRWCNDQKNGMFS